MGIEFPAIEFKRIRETLQSPSAALRGPLIPRGELTRFSIWINAQVRGNQARVATVLPVDFGKDVDVNPRLTPNW